MSQASLKAPVPDPKALQDRITDRTIANLTSYGRVLREEDLEAYRAVARTIAAMVHGTAGHCFYISPQPTGAGKTEEAAAAVREIVCDPALSHVGVLILVNTLDQIEPLVERMGLEPHQYAVRAAKDEYDLNEMGLIGLCITKGAKKVAHRYAQVLITTQQKVAASMRYGGPTDFDHMAMFDYCGPASPEEIEERKKDHSCGCKRQVRLWDEALVPIDPVVLTHEEIAHFAFRLTSLGQARAARTIKTWLDGILENGRPYSKVPNWMLDAVNLGEGETVEELFRALAEGGEKESIITDAMFFLQGREVKVLRQDYNKQTVAISYRQSIPYNIEPLLILDAAGESAMHYRLMAKAHGNVVMLPPVRKTFRGMSIRFFDHAAGHTRYRRTSTLEELVEVVAQAILEKPPGEPVLIFHWEGEGKRPANNFRTMVQQRVREMRGDPSVLRFLTWGRHRWTNEHREVKHVILAGLLNVPPPEITAMLYGASGKPMNARLNPTDFDLMRMAQVKGDVLQAIGRGASREMTSEGDVPGGCTVEIIASSWGPMGFREPLKELAEMFPGARIEPWHPRIAGKPDKETTVAEAAVRLLRDQSEVVVSTAQWAAEAASSASTIQRHVRSGRVLDLLRERGIEMGRVPSPKGQGRWRLYRSPLIK